MVVKNWWYDSAKLKRQNNKSKFYFKEGRLLVVVLGNFFLIQRMCRWGLLFVEVWLRKIFGHISPSNQLLLVLLRTHSLYHEYHLRISRLLLSWVVVVLVE